MISAAMAVLDAAAATALVPRDSTTAAVDAAAPQVSLQQAPVGEQRYGVGTGALVADGAGDPDTRALARAADDSYEQVGRRTAASNRPEATRRPIASGVATMPRMSDVNGAGAAGSAQLPRTPGQDDPLAKLQSIAADALSMGSRSAVAVSGSGGSAEAAGLPGRPVPGKALFAGR